MKKLFAYIVLLGVSAFLCSCEKEMDCEGTAETTFNVQVPAQQSLTRTVSQGENADVVYYEVWDEDFAKRLFPYPGSGDNVAPIKGGSASITLDLVREQVYNIIFWAQNSGCGAYRWSDLKEVNVDYSKFTADQKDVYDAFYSVERVVVDGSPKSVYLYRPFAQVNFGASQMNSSLGKILLQGNTVEISEVAGTFNTVAGVGENPVKNVVFSTKADFVEDKTIEVDNSTLSWVAMNYLLVSSTNVEVTANFSTNFGNVRHVVENVPVQRNFRTNIVGDLFTTGASLRIIVKPDFVKPEIPPIEINQ